MKIKILEPLIANQIAAGEVIERPASIVKECLENSLDAGATQLSIDIVQGGMQLIQILDNGHGIAKEDLPNAVKRHGTSKISHITDLNSIASLGFRGEALASICAIGRVSIASTIADQPHGWQLIAEGTDLTILEKPIAHPVGTSITVRDLFFNTPARRRFLKTEKTEFSHIEEIVKRIALSRFNIAIKLTHNHRQIFQLPAATTAMLEDKRVSQLCNKGFIEAALKFDVQATDLRLYGWIAEPNFCRLQSDMQYLFINGRIVRDKLLNHAIRQAYQPFLSHDVYPAYILYLECHPNTVDVNVHPTKHEVRFHQSRLIHDFVLVNIKKILTKKISPISDIEIEPETVLHTNNLKAAIYDYQASTTASSPLAIAEQTSVYAQQQQDLQKTSSCNSVEITKTVNSNLGEPLVVISEHFLITKNIHSLGVIHLEKAYIILFTKSLLKRHIVSKPLLFPITINLPVKISEKFSKFFPVLNNLGFLFEVLGENQFILRQAPLIMDRVDFSRFSSTLAEQLYSQQLSFRGGATRKTSKECTKQYMTEMDECCNKLENSSTKSIEKVIDNDSIIKKVAYIAATTIRTIETKAAQEKFLHLLQQQFTDVEIKACYQMIDTSQLSRIFSNV